MFPYPIAIITLGCKLNQLESEGIAGAFKKSGFTLIQDIPFQGPGIVIINTCTVTSKADQKCRRIIRKALRENPDSCVIVTGCYARLDPDEITSLEAGIPAGIAAGIPAGRLLVLNEKTAKSALLNLPEYLLNNLPAPGTEGLTRICGKFFTDTLKHTGRADPFDFKPEEFAFHSRGYLKIQDGCDNVCAYCRARLARGPSVSLSPREALARLRSFEDRGCPELMITGVNISQYRHSGLDLGGLVAYLLDGSSSIALRISSLEPDSVDEALAGVLAHPRVRPHFHLSIQSGSDTVLRRMGRAYGARDVERGAALLRSVKDNPFLACDIIAGFPGESEGEFNETLNLCRRIGFAWIHAFPYSKRPGTKAFTFENPVCARDITRRTEELTSLTSQLRRDYAASWLGRELSAIVEKSAGTTERQCRAVSENYLKLRVNCPGECPPPGTSIQCRIESLRDTGCGELPDATAEQVTINRE